MKRAPINGSQRFRLDADLRFVESRAAARGTLARFRQLLFVEGEAAGATAGRNDDDPMAGCACRTERVPQVFSETQFASEETDRGSTRAAPSNLFEWSLVPRAEIEPTPFA
jgi:hypothetical protein